MRKNVPFSINYDVIKSFGAISSYILWFSAIISIVILLLYSFHVIGDEVKLNVNRLLCVLAVSYFILDLVQNYLFLCSENKRRDDFIDNSLSTKLSESNSDNYFTNDEIESGPYKLGVNCFENSFFTKEISGKMLNEMYLKSGIILFLFLLLSIFPSQGIVVIILQLTLPFTILKQTFRLQVYHNQVALVFNNFMKIFSVTEPQKRDHIIIHNVLKYETTLSWASIHLKESIFNKLNTKLSSEWETLKHKYIQ